MEPVPNLLLLIIGAFLGITLGLFLLAVKSSKSKANIFLGIYVLLISIYIIQGALYRVGWLPAVPHIINLQVFYEVSAGALIYLYVRACTEKDFSMQPILWLHFIPVLLAVVYYFPYFLQSGEDKVALYYAQLFENVKREPPVLTLVKALIGLVYWALSFRLIQQYKKHLTNEASSIDDAYARWLRLFSSSVLLPMVGLLTWVILGAGPELRLLIMSLIFIFVFSIYVVVLFKPEIFHTFPNRIVVKAEEEEKKQKYESSTLQDSKKEKFVKTLIAYMDTEKPHRESDLTLSALAERVNIPSHYLSQVINEKMECSFLDFINGYRVEEAKRMLRDVNYENYTIMAVAYEAGFNSKTAFYAAFKKHAGMTPSAFKKSRSLV